MKIQYRYVFGIPYLVFIGLAGGSILAVALAISIMATLTDLLTEPPDDKPGPPPPSP